MHTFLRKTLALLATLPFIAGAMAQSVNASADVSANTNASAVRATPQRGAFPLLTLQDTKSHGQRAIDVLGDRLPEVAAWYGKSTEELHSLLLNDRLIKVDRRGRLFVEDELIAPLPKAAVASAANSDAFSGTLAPLDQTFLLHSRPGAKRTIYLNFRGATLSNTAWSTTTVVALPFDLDGLPYSFNSTELERIQYIWQRVVEDFAPFDVDVTTEPPPADRLTRSSSTDDIYGTTVVITSRSGVYSCSCGGVAYIGVFNDTSDFYKPALVFWDALGSNEKNIAEAISHEAGHNMGLNHDGTASSGYYGGHGSGATGWAPIMGVGYYQALVQWSRGEYLGANNVQDDYTVMNDHGLPRRADDHGNTIATATAMMGTSSGGISTHSASGVIESPSDIDMFSFNAAAGNVTVTLATAARSANLDAVVELRNAAGQLLASANPLDALNASLSFTVPSAGSYFVSVRGTGKGDPLGTGYSNYGSVGQYALTVTAATGSGVPPNAVLNATPATGTAPLNVAFSSAGSSDPDGSIVSVQWIFGDGSSASGAQVSHVYSTVGSFTAEMRLTDNSGLVSARTVTINAQAPVVVQTSRVADIAMGLRVQRNGIGRGNAVVTVRDDKGNVLSGATVNGQWSGIVSGSSSAVSSTGGAASFSSPQTRATGTFVFTVTGVTLAGYSYNAALNTETSDSITR